MTAISKLVNTNAFLLTAPYVVWMVLMAALPETAWAYAARSGITAAFLCFSLVKMRPTLPRLNAAVYGLLTGAAVFAIWISPELIFYFERAVAVSSPYDPAVCGWTLTFIKLCGSAFVIAVAEELFFRRWLVEFAGFWWMVALFAVEHGERWHVGAITGIVYGVLSRRYGLKAAVIAHVVTNLVLGLHAIFGNRWYYW